MSIRRLMIAISVMIFWGITGCSTDEVLPTSKYFNESFADLDIATISGLETPYEAVFGTPAGGRITGEVTLDEISAKLADIFANAIILEAEVDTERGLSVWEIKLKMSGGGILEVDFIQELGEILKMEGKSGPFDYEINPGGDFITLSAAIAAAKDFKDGVVVKWELSLEEENHWEYEIHIENENAAERFEIEVNAFTGELISAKEKDEEDDHESEDFDPTISQDLEDFVHGYLAGQIIHVEHEMEDLAWKVYVKTEAGAIVEFKVSEDPYSIISIEGEEGPYTYNIELADRISFAAAKEIALNYLDGEVQEWELEFRSNEQWVYEFKIRNANGESEVEIDAVTGEIL